MSNLRYEKIPEFTREEVIRELASEDPKSVARALYAATRYDRDSQWVQAKCLEALKSPEVIIRWAAVTCLGDLAFMRRSLDTDSVIPALELATQDPQIADPAGFSLSMVRQFSQRVNES